MKRYLNIMILAMLVASLAFGFISQPQPSVEASPQNQTGVGRIRFGNATVTGSPVRVDLDNRPIANKLFDLDGYYTFNSGEHTVIFRTEETGEEIARSDFTLESATRMTVVLVGTRSEPQIIVLLDDASQPVRGHARVRAINAVQGSSAAPVTLSGETVAGALAYGTASDEAEFNAGSYALALGDKTPVNTVLLPGRYYILIFAGGDDTSSPRFIQWIGRPYRVAGFNRFRFQNLVQDAEGNSPVYKVLVNSDPIPVYQNVDFGQATNQVTVQPGSYFFEIYNQEDDTNAVDPVTTLQVDIQQDQSLFIIATGTPDNVRLNLFADDVTPVPVNSARLQVINLTTAISDFSVIGPNNVALVGQVPFGSMVSNTIAGGAYNLTLANPDTGAAIGQAEINSPSGNLTTLVVYGSDRQQWLWFNEGLNQVALVRVAHASPSVGNIDIYLNGDLMLSNFAYRNTTDYITLDPANYQLSIFAAGSAPEDAEPLWVDNLTITGNALAFTMVAMGTDNFRVNVYADNLELIPDGQARIRFINAVRNVQQVSFVNAANNGLLAGALQFGQSSDNLNVNANTRTFTVGNADTGNLFRIDSFPLTPGAYYSFIVEGDADDPSSISTILMERLP